MVDRYQVFLMTMGPGAAVYERFGHNAIVIRDTISHSDLVYNYGSFDFAAPGFVRRFVEGRPRYWLAVDDWDHTIQLYTYIERRVDIQELALLPAQKAELAFRLANNATPEHREYLYDYFRDNCSTRVRDMLDLILGGALKSETTGATGEGTLRFHMARSLTNDVAMYAGILTAMGPMADRPLDQWDEMFLPEKLQARVRELRIPDATGRMIPLISREATVVSANRYHVDAGPPRWAMRFFLAGALLAVVILSGALRGRAGWIGRGVGVVWSIVAGLGGGVLLFLWFGTNHVATRHNWNLLTLTPLALLLVVPLIRGHGGRGMRLLGVVVAATAATGLVLAAFPGVTHQVTVESALFSAPPAIAVGVLAWILSCRPAPRPPSLPESPA